MQSVASSSSPQANMAYRDLVDIEEMLEEFGDMLQKSVFVAKEDKDLVLQYLKKHPEEVDLPSNASIEDILVDLQGEEFLVQVGSDSSPTMTRDSKVIDLSKFHEILSKAQKV